MTYESATRGQGQWPKSGSRSRIVVSLIPTRTMSLSIAAGCAERRIRQSYDFSSAVSKSAPAGVRIARTRTSDADAAPSARPAASLRALPDDTSDFLDRGEIGEILQPAGRALGSLEAAEAQDPHAAIVHRQPDGESRAWRRDWTTDAGWV